MKTLLISILFYVSLSVFSQRTIHTVQINGAMKNVMHNGDLSNHFCWDTLSNQSHIYGLGPAEALSGELIILEGKCYRSSVFNSNKMKVDEVSKACAPFFVYAKVPFWIEQKLPNKVSDLVNLEVFLNKVTEGKTRPFCFKLEGEISSAIIHLVDLAKGSVIHSPDDAHKGLVKYNVENKKVTLIGFFSTEHKTIFTHHDSFMHLHLISEDKSIAGHLEEAVWKGGKLKLFLPYP